MDRFYTEKISDYLNKWGSSGAQFEFYGGRGNSVAMFGALFRVNIVVVASESIEQGMMS